MQHPPSLDVAEFRHLLVLDALCSAAEADLVATHRRLDRLRREGPDADDDGRGGGARREAT